VWLIQDVLKETFLEILHDFPGILVGEHLYVISPASVAYRVDKSLAISDEVLVFTLAFTVS
jgi:hypothetical protein